ncbi:ATP-binding protein [Flavobacterium sp.]|uniref:tetratricopeptide repeat-containing sensor histidine kinase n=1 Tax=Flavobacterium sp. TaxID=239 RepID=UPI0035272D89
MKNVVLVFVAFLVLASCNKEKTVNHNTNKLEFYFNEVYNVDLSPQEKLQKLDSAVVLVNQISDSDSLKIKNLFKVSNRYFQLFKFENYKQTTQQILRLATQQNDSVALAKANYYLGDYYFSKTQNDSAYYYYLNSDKIYQKLGIKDFNSGNAVLHKAYVLLYEKDYIGSENEAINALNIAREIEDNELIYECYSHLALTLTESKDYSKGLEYNFKALYQIDKVDLKNYISIYKAHTNNSIGNIYLKTNNFEEAKKYFSNGLKIKKIRTLQPVVFASLLDYYAYANFKTNQPCINDFKEALAVRDSINDVNGKINSRIHIAEYFLENKDTAQAFKYNNEAYTLAKKANYNQDVLTTLNLFTEIAPKEGLQYAKEYIKLTDSLQEQERNSRNKFARIEYETDEIIGEKKALSEEKTRILLGSVGTIFIVILLYVVLYQQSKQKEIKLVNEQQRINENIYQLMLNQQTKLEEVRTLEKKRIARELHDGIMNKLSSIRFNLFALSRNPDQVTIEKSLRHIEELHNVEKEIRIISHDLSNDVFDTNKNFRFVLEELLRQQQKAYKTDCNYYISEEIPWESIATKVKLNLYRILQESLNNINKHANATKITIDISIFNTKLAVTIIDNGKGFDTHKVKKGIGIQNMNERAKDCNVELIINSEIGKGTTIKLLFEIVNNE